MASVSSKVTRHQKARNVWRDCLSDARFLKKNRVTEEDQQILSDFSPLGGVKGEADVLFILDTIRWARDKK
ncbi:MAG TPA: hypothetical protein VKV03_02695 [Candidatus Binataceae bacterium]|nr:hypothetical protein [Candidatus Binataceae bacterium]